MNFSIPEIISRLVAPRHKLSCSWWLWRRLTRELRLRGQGTRESGAFLLGRVDASGRRRIVDYVLYDELDPEALSTGIVRLDGRHFGRLWGLCESLSLTVVADVHTHPGGVGQSQSDQDHPIIARADHIALIIPCFAEPPVTREKVGIYRYLGAKRWQGILSHERRAFFHIGL